MRHWNINGAGRYWILLSWYTDRENWPDGITKKFFTSEQEAIAVMVLEKLES
jgi:hypothetical protein